MNKYWPYFVFLLTMSVWGQVSVRLKPDEVALIAYGSLLNQESLEETLGRPYTEPFVDIKIKGWKRSWDVGMPNGGFYTEVNGKRITPERISYLNIRPDPKKEMTAVMFVIKKSELPSFNEREFIYDAVDLSPNIVGAKVEGGGVFAYVAKEENIIKASDAFPKVAVRKTYVDTVKSALSKRGDEYTKAFWESTDEILATL